AEFGDGPLDDLDAVVAVGQVAGEQHAAPAFGLDQLPGVAGVLVLAQVGDRDVGALLGEGDGDGTADAGVAAGDERPLAGQQVSALVAAHLVARLRGHLAGAAGVALGLRRWCGVRFFRHAQRRALTGARLTPGPQRGNTMVLWPSSRTRCSACHLTALARVRLSTSRPIAARSSGEWLWLTRATSCSMIGPSSRSDVT